MDDHADAAMADHGGERDVVRSQLDELLRSEARSGWQPPDAFWRQTRAYLAPNWDRDHGHAELVRDDESPADTLVDVTRLSPRPERVLVPRTENLPLAARVLIASRWGAVSPSARARLEAQGVDVRDVPVDEADLSYVLAACWRGEVWPPEVRKAIMHALSADTADDTDLIDLRGLDAHGPFSMSMVGLGTFVRPIPGRREWPLAVVIGDSVDDFAFAMSLDRSMGPALWVPPTVLGSETVRTAARALATTQHREDRDRPIFVTSCSLDDDAIGSIARQIAATVHKGSDRVSTSHPVLPSRRPVTIFDTQRSYTLEYEPFVEGTSSRGIRARLPTGVSTDSPFALSWWNDVIRTDHQLPPRWALNEQVVARSGGWRSRARVTRDGLAFHSHALGFIPAGMTLEQIVDAPRLRFLDAKSVFEALADHAGMTLIESAAGRFTARTTELWGGLDDLVVDLQRPLVRRILDTFQSNKDSGDDPGNHVNGRRYLSLADLNEVTKSSKELVPFLDRCLQRGILRRGLSLACDHCRSFGWYDADDVGQTFHCWRCRATTTIDSQVVRGDRTEPRWYYSLAEVAYQAYKAHFSVPVLALHKFAGQSSSVLGMTDHELVLPDDDKVEIDLWGVVDGRVVVGEAKTGNKLGRNPSERQVKVRRLRRAADLITADVVVLATATEAWSSTTLDAVERAFRGAQCEVQFLDNVDPLIAGHVA